MSIWGLNARVCRDTKLDRDVALKVLPEAFTSDPDRLARFEREASGSPRSRPRAGHGDPGALEREEHFENCGKVQDWREDAS